MTVIGSSLSSDGTGWTGGMFNTSETPAQLTLTVICITVPSGTVGFARKAAAGPVFRTVRVGAGG